MNKDFLNIIKEPKSIGLKAKRGDYRLYNPLVFSKQIDLMQDFIKSFYGENRYNKAMDLAKKELDIFFEIAKAPLLERECVIKTKLMQHPYWRKETNIKLIDAYVDLFAQLYYLIKPNESGAINWSSRNNVACNKLCCMHYFQFIDKHLIVNQRSSDLTCGFISDLCTIYLIAQLAGAEEITYISNAPHIYENNYELTISMVENGDEERRLPKFNV